MNSKLHEKLTSRDIQCQFTKASNINVIIVNSKLQHKATSRDMSPHKGIKLQGKKETDYCLYSYFLKKLVIIRTSFKSPESYNTVSCSKGNHQINILKKLLKNY